MEIPREIMAALAGREVLSGFSGGADSTALLLLLHENAGPYSLRAVHFEHGLRGAESEADADACEKLCLEKGIPFQKISLRVPERLLPGEGVEAAARRLRLESWRSLASDPRRVVALGHNANDRIENLLLRLFRGSNATGLSSMRAVQRVGGVAFVRPLLETTRAEIEAFLKDKTSWREDSTNAEESYKRNFLRRSLLPELSQALPYAQGGMRRSLKALQDDASCLEELAAKEFAAMSENASPERWRALPPALRVRVLRLRLTKLLGFDFIPDAKLVERFDEALDRAGSEPELIPLRELDGFLLVSAGGVELAAKPQDETLWSWREKPLAKWGAFTLKARLLNASEASKPQDNASALFDAASVPPLLKLGRWLEGERMTPLGRKSPERLKELFNKAGVNSNARESRPVLRLPDGEALWIPGVRRSAFAPLTEKSTEALEIKAVEERPFNS